MRRLSRTTALLTLSGALWSVTMVNSFAQRIYPINPYVPGAVAETGDILAFKPGNPYQTVIIKVQPDGSIQETVLPDGGNGILWDISDDGRVAIGQIYNPYRGYVLWYKGDSGRWYSTTPSTAGYGGTGRWDAEQMLGGYYLVGGAKYRINGENIEFLGAYAQGVLGGFGDLGSASTLLRTENGQLIVFGTPHPWRPAVDIMGYTTGYIWGSSYLGFYSYSNLYDVTLPGGGTIAGVTYGYAYGTSNNQAVRWRLDSQRADNPEPLINLLGTAGQSYPANLELTSVIAVSPRGRYIVGQYRLGDQTGHYLIDMGQPPACDIRLTLPGDVNGDGTVDDSDLLIVLLNYGRGW